MTQLDSINQVARKLKKLENGKNALKGKILKKDEIHIFFMIFNLVCFMTKKKNYFTECPLDPFWFVNLPCYARNQKGSRGPEVENFFLESIYPNKPP